MTRAAAITFYFISYMYGSCLLTHCYTNSKLQCVCLQVKDESSSVQNLHANKTVYFNPVQFKSFRHNILMIDTLHFSIKNIQLFIFTYP